MSLRCRSTSRSCFSACIACCAVGTTNRPRYKFASSNEKSRNRSFHSFFTLFSVIISLSTFFHPTFSQPQRIVYFSFLSETIEGMTAFLSVTTFVNASSNIGFTPIHFCFMQLIKEAKIKFLLLTSGI